MKIHSYVNIKIHTKQEKNDKHTKSKDVNKI